MKSNIIDDSKLILGYRLFISLKQTIGRCHILFMAYLPQKTIFLTDSLAKYQLLFNDSHFLLPQGVHCPPEKNGVI